MFLLEIQKQLSTALLWRAFTFIVKENITCRWSHHRVCVMTFLQKATRWDTEQTECGWRGYWERSLNVWSFTTCQALPRGVVIPCVNCVATCPAEWTTRRDFDKRLVRTVTAKTGPLLKFNFENFIFCLFLTTFFNSTVSSEMMSICFEILSVSSEILSCLKL